MKIYDSLKKVGEENHVRAIKKVVLQIGDAFPVKKDEFLKTWEEFVKTQNEPILASSTIEFEGVRLQSKCKTCQKTYDPSKFGNTCPYCKSEDTYLTQGAELNIKQIEVYDY